VGGWNQRGDQARGKQQKRQQRKAAGLLLRFEVNDHADELATISVSARPAAVPAISIHATRRSTMARIRSRVAPRAMRTPMSRVDCSTLVTDQAVKADQGQSQRKAGKDAEEPAFHSLEDKVSETTSVMVRGSARGTVGSISCSAPRRTGTICLGSPAVRTTSTMVDKAAGRSFTGTSSSQVVHLSQRRLADVLADAPHDANNSGLFFSLIAIIDVRRGRTEAAGRNLRTKASLTTTVEALLALTSNWLESLRPAWKGIPKTSK